MHTPRANAGSATAFQAPHLSGVSEHPRSRSEVTPAATRREGAYLARAELILNVSVRSETSWEAFPDQESGW
jgi:hypothetical protein